MEHRPEKHTVRKPGTLKKERVKKLHKVSIDIQLYASSY